MEGIVTVVGLFLLSSVKFFIAPGFTVYAGYSYIETLIITSTGGLAGVTVFYFFGAWLQKIYYQRFGKKGLGKKSTKPLRRIVKIKSKYGLIGLALLTPCIFSIPLGSLIAARYFERDRKTLPMLYGSVVLWSLVLTTIFSLGLV